ncbi:MAG: hypothetical protein HUU46_15380 [Candidatus Hydrogenedentes bacterium]|nr:hypothetical protein [Candidatus Hydrogenedentota bacterium]
MNQYRLILTTVAIALAFIAGAISAEYIPRASAQAQSVALPPIFDAGARLISPMGPVEVREIAGEWIRVKSLSALAKPDEELWMHVPALSGAWTVDSSPVEEKKL